jgi:hypothetical protein
VVADLEVRGRRKSLGGTELRQEQPSHVVQGVGMHWKYAVSMSLLMEMGVLRW